MGREMKDSGVAWIGRIPLEWDMSTLGKFISIDSGISVGKKYESETALVEVPYLRVANVQGDHLDLSDVATILVTPEEAEKYKLKPGQLLMTEGGDRDKLGRGCLWNGEIENCIHQNHVFAVQTNDRLKVRFLDYLTTSEVARAYFDVTAKKTTNLACTSKSTIQKFSIPLPPVAEQDALVKYLDMKCAEIDTILEKNRASIEAYKKLKQAVITQAVTKGIRGDRPMKGSRIEWLGDVPADWKIYRGKRLFCETNERSETGDEELLTVSHITGITPRSQKNVNMFMSESLVGYKVCHVGDIAANTMWMWQGAIGVSAYHGVISPSYNTYRQRNGDFDSQYLDYLLRIRPLVDIYNACSTGITASRLRLYPEQFLSFKFPVPPMEEQQEIVAYLGDKVSEMDTLIQKKEQFLAELEAYKKSLIYEHVTGKKETPDAT